MQKRHNKILILSPLTDQALAVARYLRRYGDDYVLHGGFMPGERVRRHEYYDEMCHVQDKALIEVYDVVLPTGAVSTYWMATHVSNFQVNDVVYTRENLICFDKVATLSKVRQLGIPVPQTYEDVRSIDIPFPIFYKQRFEKGGGPRGVVRSIEELKRLKDKDALLYQEYIPGSATYGMGFIAKSGKIITSFQHKELLSYPIQGGSAVYIRTFYDERIAAYTEKIVQSLGLSGWGLAEYKYCPKRQDYVFMEINAKLWASIEFAFMNNADFLKHLFGIDYPIKEVRSALYVDRLIALGWPEMIKHAPYILGAAKFIRYQPIGGLVRSLAGAFIPRQRLKKCLLGAKAGASDRDCDPQQG